MTSIEGILTSARYGKDQIRVFRVVRNGSVHEIVEYNVQVLLEGDIATRYDIRLLVEPSSRSLYATAATRRRITRSSLLQTRVSEGIPFKTHF